LALLGKAEKIKSYLLDILFPPRCIGCKRLGEWLCDDCLDEIERLEPPLCSLCGRPLPGLSLRICPLCQSSPLKIDGIRSIAYYDGIMREAIHRFKYSGLVELSIPFGAMMSSYLMENPLPADAIVPVPLHEERLKERGYNQAALLAHELGRKTGLPVVKKPLVRIRDTPPQVGLSADERKENMKGAFICIGEGLAGRRVLLVDDVVTTGATLEACSLALKDAKAISVWALTLARAR